MVDAVFLSFTIVVAAAALGLVRRGCKDAGFGRDLVVFFLPLHTICSKPYIVTIKRILCHTIRHWLLSRHFYLRFMILSREGL